VREKTGKKRGNADHLASLFEESGGGKRENAIREKGKEHGWSKPGARSHGRGGEKKEGQSPMQAHYHAGKKRRRKKKKRKKGTTKKRDAEILWRFRVGEGERRQIRQIGRSP